jgi:hypothetical protein
MNAQLKKAPGDSESPGVKRSTGSSGPKTIGGKEQSSKNALKFGLFTGRVIHGESLEEFNAFRSWWFDDLDPITPTQVCLAHEIVSTYWRLQRAHRAECEIIGRDIYAVNDKPQSAGFAVINDSQRGGALVAVSNAEQRLSGQLRRLLKDYQQTKRDAAEVLDV